MRTAVRAAYAAAAALLLAFAAGSAHGQQDCDVNDLNAPCPLADAMRVQGTIEQSGGRNYFWFGAPVPDMHLRIELTDLPADYDLYLFSDQSADPSQPYVQSVSPGLTPEVIDRDLPDAGTYLVEVVSDPNQPAAPGEPYTLVFGLQTPAAPTPTPEPPPPPPPPTATPEPTRVVVPPVAYRPAAIAAEQMRNAGLVPQVQTADRYSPGGAGTVAAQDPPAGTAVQVGTTVRLVVASGDVAIPSVVGLSEQAATQQLREAGFAIDTRHAPNGSVPAGYVSEVRPGAGASLPAGATVIMIVSLG